MAADPPTQEFIRHADRDPRDLRADARPGQAAGLRLPGDQRDVKPDAERGAARASPTPRATASSRSPPAAPSTCPASRSRTWSPARSRSPSSPTRSPSRYPVNVALHTDHCPKDKLDGYMRPLVAISAERVQERQGAAVPVAHVGRLGGAARGEPGDRQGPARQVRRGQDHHGARDRRRRRRGGRRRRRDQREAVHHDGGCPGHGGGAGPRRARPLHARRDLRQRARRLQAGQRQAAPERAQGDPGRGRRQVRQGQAVRPGLPRRLRLGASPRSARRSATAW